MAWKVYKGKAIDFKKSTKLHIAHNFNYSNFSENITIKSSTNMLYIQYLYDPTIYLSTATCRAFSRVQTIAEAGCPETCHQVYNIRFAVSTP